MEFRLSIIHQNPSGHTNPYGVSKRVHELAFGIIICPGHVPIARRVACPPRPAPSTARCLAPSPHRLPLPSPSAAARSPRSEAATRREHHGPRAALPVPPAVIGPRVAPGPQLRRGSAVPPAPVPNPHIARRSVRRV